MNCAVELQIRGQILDLRPLSGSGKMNRTCSIVACNLIDFMARVLRVPLYLSHLSSRMLSQRTTHYLSTTAIGRNDFLRCWHNRRETQIDKARERQEPNADKHAAGDFLGCCCCSCGCRALRLASKCCGLFLMLCVHRNRCFLYLYMLVYSIRIQ